MKRFTIILTTVLSLLVISPISGYCNSFLSITVGNNGVNITTSIDTPVTPIIGQPVVTPQPVINQPIPTPDPKMDKRTEPKKEHKIDRRDIKSDPKPINNSTPNRR